MNIEDVEPRVGVYVLLGGGSGYMYKGSARDLRKRIDEHMNGSVPRTRNRRPLKLLLVEYTADYTEARQGENWLKSGQGRKWLKDLNQGI
ncbi:MAG: GIY-YIG nuclease family protein [Lentisphaerales bacterium]|jgi:putative endonuclease|nr:MAG: GIY-YIG nuclease family protein [Lentisphaerales bacterium]